MGKRDKQLVVDEEFLQNFTSENTRCSYKRDIEKFFKYLSRKWPDIDSIEKVDRIYIVKYRNYLSEIGGRDGEPASPKTIGRSLASLSSYFSFLVEKGVFKVNPCSCIKRPRQEVLSPTTALASSQVQEIFQTIAERNTNSSKLHLALLTTFFTTGLRRNEVLSLKFKNYKSINGKKVIQYRAKGGKIGYKLLHKICVKELDNYIRWMADNNRRHAPNDWLFQPTKNPADPKNTNKQLNPKTINEILNYYAKKIGLDFKISPHSARATFISELLRAGVDIYKVAKEVGHSSVKTTQEYDKRQKSILDSPVSKLPY